MLVTHRTNIRARRVRLYLAPEDALQKVVNICTRRSRHLSQLTNKRYIHNNRGIQENVREKNLPRMSRVQRVHVGIRTTTKFYDLIIITIVRSGARKNRAPENSGRTAAISSKRPFRGTYMYGDSMGFCILKWRFFDRL